MFNDEDAVGGEQSIEYYPGYYIVFEKVEVRTDYDVDDKVTYYVEYDFDGYLVEEHYGEEVTEFEEYGMLWKYYFADETLGEPLRIVVHFNNRTRVCVMQKDELGRKVVDYQPIWNSGAVTQIWVDEYTYTGDSLEGVRKSSKLYSVPDGSIIG